MNDYDFYELNELKQATTMSIELTTQEAQTLKSVLHAVSNTWRRYLGMNIGSSQVHNLYWSDIETLLGIHDKLPVEL